MTPNTIVIVCSVLTMLGLAACGESPRIANPDAAPESDASPEPIFETVEGSVSVFEIVATDGTQSSGDLRATFYSVNPQAVFYVETMREGSCRLLAHNEGFCDPHCDIVEVCTHENVCENVGPESRSAGAISISGLVTPVTLTPMGGWYSVDPHPLPADLFTVEDTISANAPGDEISGFEVSTTGVSPADLPLTGPEHDELRLVDGDDFTITWAPAEETSRVRLRLLSPASWHGLPPRRIIECDALDTGSLVIPRALVEAFPEQARGETCTTYICPRSIFLRYHRGITTTEDGEVELVVGSKRLFYLLHEVQ